MTRYYSARRSHSKWSRARDVALVAALLLAPLATLAMGTLVVKRTERDHVHGRIMLGPRGAMFAQLVDADLVNSPWLADTTPISQFEVTAHTEDRGWPVTTVRIVQEPKVAITEVAERRTRSNVLYSADDAEAVAIAAGLESQREADLAAAWKNPQPERNDLFFGWVFSIVLWMVMLWVFFMILIVFARLLTFLLFAKTQIRGAHFKAEGKCVNCGYDLRGLEFQDRCPECGQLAW